LRTVLWRDLLTLRRFDVVHELTILARRLDRAAPDLAALKVF